MIKVLLVEDDLGDVILTTENLKKSKLVLEIEIVENGEEAINYIKTNSKDIDLILLDLNLPKVDGKEVLKFVKDSNEYKKIPVIILTTSNNEIDILQTYDLRCNAYITKPVGLEEFAKVVQSIDLFWFTVVKYPPNGK